MSHPSIVVFDVGNVLIDWDMRLVYRPMFNDDAAMERFIEETDLVAWNYEQDRGRSWLDAEELLIGQFPHFKKEILAFRAQWDDMVPGALPDTVDLFRILKRNNVPLYAITNFETEMFERARARFDFLNHFIDVVVSATEKMVKPDTEIYQLLLDRNNLKASDCLFVDDKLENIEACEIVGMVGHHFVDANGLKTDLLKHGFAV
ncbi:MAG: 2-haloalkanoic acid dehalogenase [Hyphomicrobiales bacterium]|nr:MAG: 2-haloalkanoic acid dehalogenase [Hyphomicrobiales bacterium]